MEDIQKIKILVAGNATIDEFVDGSFKNQDGQITIKCEGFHRTFTLIDPPFKPGYKHRIDVDVEKAIHGLKVQPKPGGGGINSAVSMFNRAPHETYLEFNYVDMSEIHTLIQAHLDNLGINYQFFGYRSVPFNIIMGTRDDKLTLKGPMLPRAQLAEKNKITIDSLVDSSNAIFGNGLKDDSLAEYLIHVSEAKNIPLFFLVTSSLDRTFFERQMLGKGTIIINQEDIFRYLGGNPQYAEPDQMFSMSVEYLKSLIADKKIGPFPIFVTMGENGALCWAQNLPIRHVRLNDDATQKLRNYHFKDTTKISGMGDTFGGEVVMQYIQFPQRSLLSIAERASKAALRRMGYEGQLINSSFKSTEIPLYSAK